MKNFNRAFLALITLISANCYGDYGDRDYQQQGNYNAQDSESNYSRQNPGYQQNDNRQGRNQSYYSNERDDRDNSQQGIYNNQPKNDNDYNRPSRASSNPNNDRGSYYYNQPYNDRGSNDYNNNSYNDRGSSNYNNDRYNDRGSSNYNNDRYNDRGSNYYYNRPSNNCEKCNLGNYYNRSESNNPQANNQTQQNGSNMNSAYYSRQDNTKSMSDTEVSKKVNDTIKAGWMSQGYPNVTFEVNNGTVTLKGTVKSMDDKNKLEEAIRKVDGVKQIDNQVSVVPEKQTSYNDKATSEWNQTGNSSGTNAVYYSRQDTAQSQSDADISKKVNDSIKPGMLSQGYPNVTSEVNNGIVTLNGTVKSIDEKNKLEDTIRKIDGVKQIINQITVVADKKTAYNDTASSERNKQDSAVTDSDREINANIRNKLSGWFSKDYSNIVLRTDNGIVTITGSVDSSDDMKKINDKVKSVPGVKTANIQLVIKNK